MQKVSLDESLMRLALAEAEKGLGRVHPNPLVGAVLAKGGKVLSRGAHRYFGGPHAEADTLKNLKKIPAGSTLYSTLEPCVHFGKTPPCAELLLAKKISRVVVAAKDPNPLVSGRGISLLKKAGVKVTLGVLRGEAEAMNRDFRQWVLNKTPYVILKVAQSWDGKITTRRGQGRWISGKESRALGHKLRARADAVLVGVNTVLKDDPRLNARLPGVGAQPLKVILDATLKTPTAARLFSGAPVIIFTTRRASKARLRSLERKAQILIVREKGKGRVDLKEVLKVLGKRGVVNLLVEGGGEVIASMLKEKLAKEAYVFVASRLLDDGVRRFSHGWSFRRERWSRVGEDLLLHGMF